MWKLSPLDLSLARGYFMHKYVQHMPIAMCYRQEYIYFANAKLSLSLLDSHYAMHHHLEIEERIYNWKQAEKIYGLADLADSS